MRSGLQKPGAIPFLALLVFSLLSLVPSLSSQWEFNNVKAGYIDYRPNEVRHLPRIKDEPVTARSSVRAIGQCQPWLEGSYQPCSDRIPRSQQPAIDTPPRSSFEIAPIFDHTPPTSTFKQPSSLTKGVRAFKTFFIQQLDDYRFLRPFSTRNVSSVKTGIPRPASKPTDSSAAPVSSSNDESQHRSYNKNYATISSTMQGDQDYGLQTLFRDTWQQVCHAGIDLYGHIHTPIRHFGYFTSQCSRYLGSTVGRDSLPMTPTQRYESASSKELAVNGSRLQPNLQPTATPGDSMSTQTPNAAATPAEQSKVAGVGGNTEQMRSSCMAIVIGLVVGIMWF